MCVSVSLMFTRTKEFLRAGLDVRIDWASVLLLVKPGALFRILISISGRNPAVPLSPVFAVSWLQEVHVGLPSPPA